MIQQRLKGVQAVADDDEGPDAAETMDFVMTPENFPQPKKDNGHIIILQMGLTPVKPAVVNS